MILDLIVSAQGYRTVCCQNGYDAFLKVQESLLNPESNKFFDLIILDLNMPICGGREACKKIDALFTEGIIFRDKPFIKLSTEQLNKRMLYLSEDLVPPISSLVEEIEVAVEYMRPVIIGCTSEVLTDNLLDECALLGFQKMFNAPLTPMNLIRDLIPHLSDRIVKIVSQQVDPIIDDKKIV